MSRVRRAGIASLLVFIALDGPASSQSVSIPVVQPIPAHVAGPAADRGQIQPGQRLADAGPHVAAELLIPVDDLGQGVRPPRFDPFRFIPGYFTIQGLTGIHISMAV